MDTEQDKINNQDKSIKTYSLIESAILEIQRSEWLDFKEIKKDLLRYKHVKNEDNNLYIYYFKPKEFNYDFYYWIGKIILSKTFGLYIDFLNTNNIDVEYFIDKLRFQELLHGYAKFPLDLLPYRHYPSKKHHDQGIKMNKKTIFLQHNGVFALYLLE